MTFNFSPNITVVISPEAGIALFLYALHALGFL